MGSGQGRSRLWEPGRWIAVPGLPGAYLCVLGAVPPSFWALGFLGNLSVWSRLEVSKLWTMGHIWPATYFCVAHKLKMVFTCLNDPPKVCPQLTHGSREHEKRREALLTVHAEGPGGNRVPAHPLSQLKELPPRIKLFLCKI